MPVKAALVAASLFGDFVRDALRFVAGVVIALLVPVALVVVVVAMFLAAPFAAFGGGGGSEPPPPPLDHLAVMVEVSNETGVPWSLLAAIASVESGFGSNMATSWAGAIGYGQFMPASWDYWGEGDPYDFRDAIPAMARYLLDHRVLTDIPAAVFAYNRSWEYVAFVVARMAYYDAAFAEAAAALGASPVVPPGGGAP